MNFGKPDGNRIVQRKVSRWWTSGQCVAQNDFWKNKIPFLISLKIFFWHTVCLIGKCKFQIVFSNSLGIKSICQSKTFLSRKIIGVIIFSNLNGQSRSSFLNYGNIFCFVSIRKSNFILTAESSLQLATLKFSAEA